jgi:hypothetical protein
MAAYDDLKQAVRTGTFDARGRGFTISKDAPLTFAQLVDLYELRYVKRRS